MTPKQIEKIKTKIRKIRTTLANEKRKFGCYDDSRGLRYFPPELYVKIQDYKGGLTYLRWFNKNFPDDMGMPDFLFGVGIILFKNEKYKDAEKKIAETFCANTYVIDKYFLNKIEPITKYEWSNIENIEYAEYFSYSKENPELKDFTVWLEKIINSEKFITLKSKFIDLNKRLLGEEDSENRMFFLSAIRKLKNDY